MTLMFLWVFYRAKEDGAVMLVRLLPGSSTRAWLERAPTQGLIHPWDAHGGHGGGHGHGDHDDEDEEEGDDEDEDE